MAVRFQFTIGRMLFATAAFAAMLKLFSPLDALSLVFAIPISCAIFAFTLLVKEPTETIDSNAYSSRRQAVLAGLRRGGLFGAKWGAIVGGALLLLVCAIFTAGPGIGADIAGPLLLVLAFLIGIPATFGALMMGIGNGVYYRQPSAHLSTRDQIESVTGTSSEVSVNATLSIYESGSDE
jgi:hypothetical protein